MLRWPPCSARMTRSPVDVARVPDDQVRALLVGVLLLLADIADAQVGTGLDVGRHPLDDVAYAFVTVRMVGSAFELCADHVAWVLGEEAAAAVAALRRIVEGSKVLSFRLARRRPFDPAAVVDTLAVAWDEAMAALAPALA